MFTILTLISSNFIINSYTYAATVTDELESYVSDYFNLSEDTIGKTITLYDDGFTTLSIEHISSTILPQARLSTGVTDWSGGSMPNGTHVFRPQLKKGAATSSFVISVTSSGSYGNQQYTFSNPHSFSIEFNGSVTHFYYSQANRYTAGYNFSGSWNTVGGSQKGFTGWFYIECNSYGNYRYSWQFPG